MRFSAAATLRALCYIPEATAITIAKSLPVLNQHHPSLALEQRTT